MKLALGTVQFGLPYGATNKQGQVGAGEIERILARARAAGIDLLDTAAAYGTSEDVLGASDEARAGFSIVTKTQPLRLESIDAEAVERVVDGVRRSVRRLHVAALDGLLVHHAPDLLAPGGDRLYDALQSLRAEGLVRRLGASVYTVDQLLTLLERYPLEIVQLPMNVLDQAFLQTGTLDRLARGGIEVHVRSIFLQGILLAERLPRALQTLEPGWLRFQECCAQAGLSSLQGCLAYLKTCEQVSYGVVGVEDSAQLGQILDAWEGLEGRTLPDFTGCNMAPEKMLNPSNWPAVERLNE